MVQCARFCRRFDVGLRVNDVVGFLVSYKFTEHIRASPYASIATCIAGVIRRIDLYDERHHFDFVFVP